MEPNCCTALPKRSINEYNNTAWQTCGAAHCDCFSKQFEAWDLLFHDRDVELQYLTATKFRSSYACCCYFSAPRLILAFFSFVLICVGASSWGFIIGGNILNSLAWLWMLAGVIALIMCSFIIFPFCSHLCCCSAQNLRTRANCSYSLTCVVIWIYTIMVPFVFWADAMIADSLFNGSSLNLTWPQPSTANSSQLVFSSFLDFKTGIVFSAPFVGLSNLWVLQKIIVIFDLLPARLFSVIVPFNAVTMFFFFYIVWLTCFVRYLQILNQNIDPNGIYKNGNIILPSAVPSLSFTVQVVFQLLIGVLGASFALLWTIMRLDMGAREMFIWTVGLEKRQTRCSSKRILSIH